MRGRMTRVVVAVLAGSACGEPSAPSDAAPPVEPAGRAAPPGPDAVEELSPRTDPWVPPRMVEPPLVAGTFPADLSDASLTAMYDRMGGDRLDVEWMLSRVGRYGGSEAYGGLEEWGATGSDFVAEATAYEQRRERGEAESGATLLALVVAAEAVPLFDERFAGHVWRLARACEPGPDVLFARLERHLRVVHALARAEQDVGRIKFATYRSKSGPPAGFQWAAVPRGLTAAARDAFATADAGTWEKEATLSLRVATGSVVLVRRGVETTISAGEGVRLRRLDVIRSPTVATLEHETLGGLLLRRGDALTAWNAPEFLLPLARARVEDLVASALAGDERAPQRLLAVLPAAHQAIRAGLRTYPIARGATTLHAVLERFDE